MSLQKCVFKGAELIKGEIAGPPLQDSADAVISCMIYIRAKRKRRRHKNQFSAHVFKGNLKFKTSVIEKSSHLSDSRLNCKSPDYTLKKIHECFREHLLGRRRQIK